MNNSYPLPKIVDRATWQEAPDRLLEREKAHTREGDRLAAARRALPMVEVDATAPLVGRSTPVPAISSVPTGGRPRSGLGWRRAGPTISPADHSPGTMSPSANVTGWSS